MRHLILIALLLLSLPARAADDAPISAGDLITALPAAIRSVTRSQP